MKLIRSIRYPFNLKTILTSFTIIAVITNSFSQNVGIGTNNPQTKLDILGNIRVGGASRSLQYDSLDGKFTWTNSYLWLPGAQYIARHSASSEGLYYANAQLEYRNSSGNAAFFTNWNTGNGFFRNNLGIGHLNPAYPLSFQATTGEKISLYGDGDSYGFAVEPYTLRIHTDAFPSDIVFGYGNGFGFFENVRMKGSGNVGIGTPNPTYKLEVNGSIKAADWVVANSFRLANPKTYYYTVPSSAFHSMYSSSFFYADQSSAYFESGHASLAFAPVTMPEGANITNVTAYYNDQSTPSDLSISLVRLSLTSNFVDFITTLSSSGNGGLGTATTSLGFSHVINNVNNSYSIRAASVGATWPGSNLQIRAIVISYTLLELQ